METHHLSFPTSTLQYSESNKNFCRWLMEKDPQLRPLALQALRHEWLTCPTPTVPTTAKGQGSFADALLAMEDMPKLDAVRRQESDLDKDGYEPSPDVVAHIGPPPVPDPSALEDSRPIPIRGSALGFQLNTSKIPKRNPKPTAAI
jgi:serine/threonine protein kinase